MMVWGKVVAVVDLGLLLLPLLVPAALCRSSLQSKSHPMCEKPWHSLLFLNTQCDVTARACPRFFVCLSVFGCSKSVHKFFCQLLASDEIVKLHVFS
eukprot:m.195661 g.195661  ORF g.195661 m.195661 type:complete len:97 (-) comp14893_c0_seq7:29-319(-)